jgi:hypothetical protein
MVNPAPTLASHSPETPGQSPRALVFAAVGTVIGTAAFLAGVMVVVNRAEWWRGYTAASIAAALAAASSLVPLVIGVKRGGALLVQMFMMSSALRGFIAIGSCALAVGVGRYPALPTFVLVIPYYLALLAIESLMLSRGLKVARS